VQGSVQAVNLLALLPAAPQHQSATCPSAAGIGATAASAVPPPAIRALINETARDVGIDANLLRSVMSVESGFNTRAVSPKMAAGLMQLMPETAIRYGVQNTFDEHQNVLGGASYLRDLLRLFGGNVTLTLAAYNAGEAAVLGHGGVPPFQETINYVALVKRLCACGN
jgi:soluble lytic murein transglycosylase-like protein